MFTTLMLVAAAAVTATVLYAVASRAATVALAGEHTVVGLGDPTSDTLASGDRVQVPTHTDWQLATVTDLSDAEDLLDTLENQGYAERELVVLGNACFAVRWR